MNRITINDVLAAAKSTGVTLARKVDCGNGRPGTGFFSFRRSCTEKPKCACGLGVLFLAQNTREHYGEIDVQWWAERTFERHYRQGFAEGFDGDAPNEKQKDNATYAIGYSDGQAAALAAFSERGT